MSSYTIAKSTMVGIFVATSLSGCAFWPTLKPAEDLDPTNVSDFKCLTSNLPDAKKCALLTISELTKMMGDAGNVKRAAAYALLGIGTASGAVIALDGSKGVLEGLAIGTASLLGLITVVNPDAQRATLEAGIDATVCAYRAAQALETADSQSGSLTNLQTYSFAQHLRKVEASVMFLGVGEEEKGMMKAEAIRSGFALETMSKTTTFAKTALTAALNSAGEKLSASVLKIRSQVQKRLDDNLPNLDTIASAQRDSVITMLGEVRRVQEEQRRQVRNPPSPPEPGDTEANLTLQNAQTFIQSTSGVSTVFQDCVDRATEAAVVGE